MLLKSRARGWSQDLSMLLCTEKGERYKDPCLAVSRVLSLFLPLASAIILLAVAGVVSVTRARDVAATIAAALPELHTQLATHLSKGRLNVSAQPWRQRSQT